MPARLPTHPRIRYAQPRRKQARLLLSGTVRKCARRGHLLGSGPPTFCLQTTRRREMKSTNARHVLHCNYCTALYCAAAAALPCFWHVTSPFPMALALLLLPVVSVSAPQPITRHELLPASSLADGCRAPPLLPQTQQVLYVRIHVFKYRFISLDSWTFLEISTSSCHHQRHPIYLSMHRPNCTGLVLNQEAHGLEYCTVQYSTCASTSHPH